MNAEWLVLWMLVASLLGYGLVTALTGGTWTSRAGTWKSERGEGSTRYPGGRKHRRLPGVPAGSPYWSSAHPGMLGELWRYFVGGTSRR